MEPHRPISNSIVKGYSGEDTERGAFWENNTMSKFLLKNSSFLKKFPIFFFKKKMQKQVMRATNERKM